MATVRIFLVEEDKVELFYRVDDSEDRIFVEYCSVPFAFAEHSDLNANYGELWTKLVSSTPAHKLELRIKHEVETYHETKRKHNESYAETRAELSSFKRQYRYVQGYSGYTKFWSVEFVPFKVSEIPVKAGLNDIYRDRLPPIYSEPFANLEEAESVTKDYRSKSENSSGIDLKSVDIFGCGSPQKARLIPHSIPNSRAYAYLGAAALGWDFTSLSVDVLTKILDGVADDNEQK
ncbi:MAG: hypothetical protein ACRDL7_03105, partial [Gaiellaceae bacterium]